MRELEICFGREKGKKLDLFHLRNTLFVFFYIYMGRQNCFGKKYSN